MQMVGRELEAVCSSFDVIFRSGSNSELAPQSVNVFLLVGDPCVLHEVKTNCRVGAVCTDHEVEGDFEFFLPVSRDRFSVVAVLPLEPGAIMFKVRASKFTVEVKVDIRHAF